MLHAAAKKTLELYRFHFRALISLRQRRQGNTPLPKCAYILVVQVNLIATGHKTARQPGWRNNLKREGISRQVAGLPVCEYSASAPRSFRKTHLAR